ncbi:MAG: hypothetical protein HYV62_10760, partial [Candidatus Rokubacteria bacterium]|nr:hypothetical protein [Candidatus Rokubacteria bacterium]
LALRWGDRVAALQHLRYVLAVDPLRREAALQLVLALLPMGESLASFLPMEPEPLAGLFVMAVRQGDTSPAQAFWERRAVMGPPLSLDLQRRHLQALLEQGDGPLARRVWLAIAPNGGHPQPDNAVWNGGFEADRLLGWGFDWRIRRLWGVEVSLDHFVAAEGRQSLRLAFNSVPALDFTHVSQYVPVEPGREYRLRALAKALDLATASGLKLQLATADGETVLAETGAIAGTTPEWVPLETRSRVPPGVSLVRLQLRREPAPGPEANLAGKVWLDEVTLTPARARIPSPPKGAEG